jgi:hypothetical protein
MFIAITDTTNFKKTAIPVTATVTSVEEYTNPGDTENNRHYNVYVEYEVNDQTYNTTLQGADSSMRVGDTKKVYYNPQNPEDVRVSHTNIFWLFWMTFALVFPIIGLLLIFKEVSMAFYINTLISKNIYVTGNIINEVDSNTEGNGSVYKRIVAIAKDSRGESHGFLSQPYNPSKCQFDRDKPVTIYVDIDNKPDKYYVDRDQY